MKKDTSWFYILVRLGGHGLILFSNWLAGAWLHHGLTRFVDCHALKGCTAEILLRVRTPNIDFCPNARGATYRGCHDGGTCPKGETVLSGDISWSLIWLDSTHPFFGFLRTPECMFIHFPFFLSLNKNQTTVEWRPH